MKGRMRIALLASWLVITSACADRSEQDLQAILAWSPESLGSVEPQVRRQFDRALGHLESRMQRAASDQEIAAAVGQLAMLHHVYQNTDQALTGYQVAQRLDDSDPRWPYYRGFLLTKGGQHHEVIRAYSAALDVNPNLWPTRIRLAEAQTAAGDLDGALSSFAALPTAAQQTARVLSGMGELALARQENDRAVDRFRQALELQPDSHRVRLGLGQALREAGQIDEARQILADAGAVTAQDAELGFPDPLLAALYENNISSQRIWEVGQIRLREGRAEEALSLFRRAAEIVPDRESYGTDVGNALAAMGRLEEALQEFQVVVSRDPTYLPALAGMAKAQSRLGRRSEAIGTYKKLLELDEAHPEIHLELAHLLRIGGDGGAADHYRRVLELDPKRSSAYGWLAWLEFGNGRPEESLEILREGLLQDPESAWLDSLEMRIRSSSTQAAGDASLLSDAALLLRGNPTAFNAETLALVYASAGDFDLARSWQEAVVVAARELGLDADLMQRRLQGYQRSRIPGEILASEDTQAARVPLRRADFDELAPTLPNPSPL